MTAAIMANPLKTLGKMRGKSLGELIVRGGQAYSAYREQKGHVENVPSDEELAKLIDRSYFGKSPIISESLFQKFFGNGDTRFFPCFKNAAESVDLFKRTFGESAAKKHIERAESIIQGRIKILGLPGLYVGRDIDWHLEPISQKRSPSQHWKQFDETDQAQTGDRKIIWELNRHQHFFTLGFAYWLTGDERFARCYIRHITSWMDQNPNGVGINWSSSLEVSFRAMSWLWAFHFFRDSDALTPDIFKRALKFLYLHARHIEKYLSTYYSPNTHLTGEGLGLYYLGTQLPFFTRSKQWRKLGADILNTAVTRHILPDGVYFEQSTWYQRYTVDFYCQFIILQSLYGTADGGKGQSETFERVKAGLDFLMYATRPDGSTPLIGDDDGGRALPLTCAEPDDFRGTLSVGAALFKQSKYKHVSRTAGEEVFWLLGESGINTFEDLEAAEPKRDSMDFAHGGYFVMRDGWSDTDNYMMIDCGELGAMSGGHGHADALSIDVALQGRSMLVDSGTYTYHESRDMRDYFRSSMAHNTLEIDRSSSSVPGGTFNWKTRANAELKTWIAEDRFDLFEGAHHGYERLDDPATHHRSILFLKNDYWIIRDFVTASGDHEYALNFHCSEHIKPGIAEDGNSAGDANGRIFVFGDNGRWQQKESWVSNVHGNKNNATFLRFISKGTGMQEFYSFIIPSDFGPEAPEVSEVFSTAGRAFIVRYRGYTDFFVFNDDGETLNTGPFETDFKYSWARLAAGERIPEEFVMLGGSRLTIDGNKVVDQSQQFACVRRLGNELYIKTDKGRSSLSFAFDERRKGERRRSPQK